MADCAEQIEGLKQARQALQAALDASRAYNAGEWAAVSARFDAAGEELERVHVEFEAGRMTADEMLAAAEAMTQARAEMEAAITHSGGVREQLAAREVSFHVAHQALKDCLATASEPIN